jgi:pimeloyl-ACP methyl ester carboxylesterase
MADAGGDARPAIVLLHATRLTGAQWAAQVADLSPAFRCLTPDLPGHGTAADIPFTLESAARGVADLIDAETGGRAVVVGLSLGGYVAMDVAARWPERVRGLVIAGASAEPAGRLRPLVRALATTYDGIDERWLTRRDQWYFRSRFSPTIAEPIVAGGFHFRGGATALRSLMDEEFRSRLAAYPGRTVIVNGEFDPLFRLSAPSFARAARAARRVLLPGATHLSNLDRPRSFSAAVRSLAVDVDTPPD